MMRKKLCIAMTAVGAAAVAVKVIDCMNHKSFVRGLNFGQLIGSVTAIDRCAHDQTVMKQKYEKLSKEHDELQKEFNEMLDYYGDDE